MEKDPTARLQQKEEVEDHVPPSIDQLRGNTHDSKLPHFSTIPLATNQFWATICRRLAITSLTAPIFRKLSVPIPTSVGLHAAVCLFLDVFARYLPAFPV